MRGDWPRSGLSASRPTTRRIVVVGASLAGIRVVQGLRRRGSDASITLVEASSAVACDRPPLSKRFLIDPALEAAPLVTADQLVDLEVAPEFGRRAVDLDVVGRDVGLDDGRRLPYDALVIATGSAPRHLPGVDPTLPGVNVLRTAEDAKAIRAALAAGARTVVVGGGFIGAETAWTARSLGREVTVVEPLPTLMSRGLGRTLGEVITRRHAESGTRLRLGVGVSAVAGAGRAEEVLLSDGTAIPADLVVVGVGSAPQTGWLAGSGLETTNGVHCDGYLAAHGARGVYVVGDVARWDHPGYGTAVRVEHWTNAVEHANAVASTLTGTPATYAGLPYVWSEQLGARLQILGHVGADDEVRYVFGGPEEPHFVALAGSGARFNAVVGYGAVREMLPFRRLLVDGAAWPDVRETAGAGS